MIKLLPVDSFILSHLRVPYKDIRTIIRSMERYQYNPDAETEHFPKTKHKRSLIAWSFMVFYRENPIMFFIGFMFMFLITPSVLIISFFLGK